MDVNFHAEQAAAEKRATLQAQSQFSWDRLIRYPYSDTGA
jgi:hypothetical protein